MKSMRYQTSMLIVLVINYEEFKFLIDNLSYLSKGSIC